MASQYTTSLKIQEIGNGEQSGVWGTTTNTNWQLAEQAIAGVQTITMTNANYTLSNLNGVLDEARNMVLVVQGTNSGIYQVVAPLNQPKMYVIYNNTTGGYAITIGASSGSVITIPNGVTAQVYTDGTNFYSAQTGSAGNFTVNGTLTASGVTDTGSLSAASLSVSGASTFSTSPTAPTPTTGDNTTKIATTAFVTAAIPTTGTMATQNASAVAITGGTINGTTVGATTASNVTGTTITATTQFSGPGTGLTGTAASLTAGNATLSVNSTNALGYSQTWQDVTSSRSFGTTYTNSTGKPIQVYFYANGAAVAGPGVGFTLLLNGTLSFNDGFGPGSDSCAIQIVIPAGNTYSISQTSGAGYSGTSWYELR